jgi:hypothetical protein
MVLTFSYFVPVILKIIFKTTHMKTLYNADFPKAASAVIKLFLKAAIPHINGFPKSCGNFLKKYAKHS